MRRVEEEAILTEEGYKKILEELKYLKEVKRKKSLKRFRKPGLWAISQRTLSSRQLRKSRLCWKSA